MKKDGDSEEDEVEARTREYETRRNCEGTCLFSTFVHTPLLFSFPQQRTSKVESISID